MRCFAVLGTQPLKDLEGALLRHGKGRRRRRRIIDGAVVASTI
jgi:hypothetical protein